MAQVIYRLPPGIGPRPMQRDATSVAGRGPEQARMNEQARKMEDEGAKTIRERKQRRKVASEAREKSGQFPDSIEDMAVRASDLGDVFRLFPDDPDSFIDDYLNPMVMVGGLAAGLGQIPFNIKQGDYGQAAFNLAVPIAAGAIERGAKIAAPIVGRYLTTQTPLANAYKVNPFAYRPNQDVLLRGLGPKGAESAFEKGILSPRGHQELYASPYLHVAESYSKKGPIAEIPKNVANWTSLYEQPGSPEMLGWDKDWSQFTKDLIPTNQVRILEPNWLWRYKEIPQTKALRRKRNK